MFRRSKSETPAPQSVSAGVAGSTTQVTGKGRPTPTRRESEAAAKSRARVPRTRKEQMAADRATRGESTAQVRAGLRSGDDRYLRPRDKGPERRFIRDFIDARFSFVELMIPVLIVSMLMGYSGVDRLARFGNTILLTAVVLMIGDVLVLRWRLRRQLAVRFPDAALKGTTYYAVTRALQLRFMRLPKTQVKIGAELPERYR